MCITGLGIGLFIGAAGGALAMAAMILGARSDRQRENYYRELDRENHQG